MTQNENAGSKERKAITISVIDGNSIGTSERQSVNPSPKINLPSVNLHNVSFAKLSPPIALNQHATTTVSTERYKIEG